MKKCCRCKELKPFKDFYPDKARKDGYCPLCKDCENKYAKEWRIKNTEKQKEISDRRYKKRKSVKPWAFTLSGIKQRCQNPKHKKYKYYGGKGIKCLITEDELKVLWFRDKAYGMDWPSIDREDSDGHYIFSNCRYIENEINCIKDCGKSILQYSLDSKFIKEWVSIREAGRILKIPASGIGRCVKKEKYYKTAGGFIWKSK